jgi:colanic acid biosynthesis glycosyl transferase WcaI
VHIVYVSAYFPPEMGASQARVSELARAWVKAGHKVTVITGFANYPTGVKAPEDKGVLYRREKYEGVDVIRCYLWTAEKMAGTKRMISFATFAASVTMLGPLLLSKPDVIIGTSPHLLVPLAGYLVARLRFRPFVFEVRDLWPESIMAVDAMKENMVIRVLRRIAKHLYFHSDRVVTLGNGYKRCINDLYKLPNEAMDVIPNGIEISRFSPSPRDNEIRKQYGWDGKFVVMYIGLHGMAQGLMNVVNAAEKLAPYPNIQVVFVGEGVEKEQLMASAAERKLTNIQFIGQQPPARIPLYYAACDLGLVSLKSAPLFQEVLPSKMFEYLGMERAMIINMDGDARQLIEQAGAGIFVPPDNPQALADAIVELSKDPARLEKMGKSGREFVVANYQRDQLAANFLQVLQKLVKK